MNDTSYRITAITIVFHYNGSFTSLVLAIILKPIIILDSKPIMTFLTKKIKYKIKVASSAANFNTSDKYNKRKALLSSPAFN
jgi:hypothetical protein